MSQNAHFRRIVVRTDLSVNFLCDVELAEAKDDVVGRMNRRFSAFIPVLSTCSSSVVVRVYHSQLLMRLGRIILSYIMRSTFASTPRMLSEDAVVFICRTVAFILENMASYINNSLYPSKSDLQTFIDIG